jgi:hypothetical protein
VANLTILELSTVATSAVSSAGNSSVAIPIQIDGYTAPETRQLTLAQLAEVIAAAVVTAGNAIKSTTAGVAQVVASSSITGSATVNTGLTTLTNVILAIRGGLTSSAAGVSWSALASTGYFSAFVYANPVSSSDAPALSTTPVTVDWISVGTA